MTQGAAVAEVGGEVRESFTLIAHRLPRDINEYSD